MSWLRLTDSFDRNPKILALGSDEKRWTWTRVLLYAANARSPIVPDNIREIVPKANKAFIDSCVNAKLLDVTEDGLLVHDWSKYQPRDATNADRQAKFRNAKVTAQTVTVTDESNGEVSNGCSRARVPVPSRPVQDQEPLAQPAAAQERPVRKARKKKEHPPLHDVVFALVSKVLKQQPANDHEYGFWHNYVGQIHKSLVAGGFEQEQWEEEIRRVCRVLYARWGNDASGINPQSLAKWWSSCAEGAGFTDSTTYPDWVSEEAADVVLTIRGFPASVVWSSRPAFMESLPVDLVHLRNKLADREKTVKS